LDKYFDVFQALKRYEFWHSQVFLFLEVIKPTADQIVTQNLLKVEGKTDSSATVKVNNQPALVSETGEFETEIEISQNTLEISVSATSRSGKESVIKRRIRPELE